ncbi:hypothetical protein B0H14DRAFT_2618359 [Mycena olivaceomarginata]|nr:hypothetical protein B0H14DRAFT_2618359 [Mycena olivaceomarginata]
MPNLLTVLLAEGKFGQEAEGVTRGTIGFDLWGPASLGESHSLKPWVNGHRQTGKIAQDAPEGALAHRQLHPNEGAPVFGDGLAPHGQRELGGKDLTTMSAPGEEQRPGATGPVRNQGPAAQSGSVQSKCPPQSVGSSQSSKKYFLHYQSPLLLLQSPFKPL